LAVAGGLWDRVLAFLGFEEEEEEPEAAAPPAAAAAPALPAAGHGAYPRRRSGRPARSAWTEEGGAELRPVVARTGNVTRLVAGMPGIVVAAPRRFEDSQEAADQLKAGKPVILYLEGMERELAQRVVNFLAGSVYALGGEMHRVGPVVLFAPAGIEVTLPLSLRMADREGR
jgi:cell division inhibitor SepF